MLNSLSKNFSADPETKETVWVDIDEILDGNVKLQSEQIRKERERYKEGKRYPLDILDMYTW